MNLVVGDVFDDDIVWGFERDSEVDGDEVVEGVGLGSVVGVVV